MIKVSSEIEFYSNNFEPLIGGITKVFKRNAGGDICIEHGLGPIKKTIIDASTLKIFYEMNIENSVWKLSELIYHINQYFEVPSPNILEYISDSGTHTRIRVTSNDEIAVCINIENRIIKRINGVSDYFEMTSFKKMMKAYD